LGIQKFFVNSEITQPFLSFLHLVKRTQLPEHLQEIINGCIKGERSAQAALYRFYCSKMMGICMWYAKNKQEAEEILQDGFMLVFMHIKTYKGEGSFEGWIRKIMVNAALAKYRSKKNNSMRIVTEYNAEVHDVAQESSVLAGLEEKEIVLLIQSLPPVYRMVFNLYVFEGMKHKEIAQYLHISEGTSKSNLADARLILQRKINQQQRAFFK
jgi:RNA polymerase sigma factor (sigma-70 family)